MHKTSAWPLALTYALLVAYASLYPFSDWRFQGISPWAFLTAALPRYWTFFDVATNLIGYGPLGFLLALGVLRSRRSDNDPGRGTTRGWRAIGRATALSLLGRPGGSANCGSAAISQGMDVHDVIPTAARANLD